MSSSTKPTYGTSGGQLHNTFPTGGRYGGETVAERRARSTAKDKEEAHTSEQNPGTSVEEDIKKT